jgi:hypothetical protein
LPEEAVGDGDNDRQDEEVQAPKKKKRGKKWTKLEDIALCESWANTSLDPKKGSDQKLEGYWIRIHENYEKFREAGEFREWGALESRWNKIRTSLLVFVGHHDRLASKNQSGKGPEDVVSIIFN